MDVLVFLQSLVEGGTDPVEGLGIFLKGAQKLGVGALSCEHLGKKKCHFSIGRNCRASVRRSEEDDTISQFCNLFSTPVFRPRGLVQRLIP